METEPTRSLEAIFSEALEHEPGARRIAFVQNACKGDPALQTQVIELIEAHDSAGEFLQEPEPPKTEAAQSIPKIPGYRVQRELGRGGIGVVYEAFDEKLQRTVALKILTRGASNKVTAEARKAASLQDAEARAALDAMIAAAENAAQEVPAAFQGLHIHDALAAAWAPVVKANEFIERVKPWALAKDPARRGELPTTRALAATTTGEWVYRERRLPEIGRAHV